MVFDVEKIKKQFKGKNIILKHAHPVSGSGAPKHVPAEYAGLGWELALTKIFSNGEQYLRVHAVVDGEWKSSTYSLLDILAVSTHDNYVPVGYAHEYYLLITNRFVADLRVEGGLSALNLSISLKSYLMKEMDLGTSDASEYLKTLQIITLQPITKENYLRSVTETKQSL